MALSVLNVNREASVSTGLVNMSVFNKQMSVLRSYSRFVTIYWHRCQHQVSLPWFSRKTGGNIGRASAKFQD